MGDSDIPLDREQRAGLVREVFEAARDVAWATDWEQYSKAPAFGRLTSEQAASVRQGYFDRLEKMWPDWKTEAAGYSDGQLYAMLEGYVDRADCLGMLAMRAEKPEIKRTKGTMV